MANLYPAIDFDFKALTCADKLIFCVLRENLNNFWDENCRNSGVDWEEFLQKAQAYRIEPLLYTGLRGFSSIPNEVIDRLKTSFVSTFYRNIVLARELSGIIKKLNERKIETIVLKGVSLSACVYDDWSLRGFNDADLLVKKEDFFSVRAVLKELGYELLCEKKIKSSLKYRSQAMFVKDGKYFIDVHWHLLDLDRYNKAINLDLGKIWDRREPLKINEIDSARLSLNDMIVYLCLHQAIQHGLKGLIWYLDIYKIIKKYSDGIDWEKIADDAVTYRVKRPVYYVLTFVSDMFNAQIPQFVFEKIKPGINKFGQGFVLRNLKRANISVNSEYILTPFLFDTLPQAANFVLFYSFRSPAHFFYSIKLFFRSFSPAIRLFLKGRGNGR
ncbi:MAG: nucleotidyltransferase family protein [Candidatus Omnitrophica bacterium]|nr:nucleotidyltransferase family protein [Candidatus Omnitrophota bacterium]